MLSVGQRSFSEELNNSHFVLVNRKKRLLLEPKKTVTKFSKGKKRKHEKIQTNKENISLEPISGKI